jgi:3-oxoacid CoA-transferase A subunit
LLVENRQVKKFISTITFPNTVAEKAILAGEVEIEFVPQGTLAERIRAGGFGIGGFYVRTGVSTLIAEGKEKGIIDGEEYLLEMPLRADYALIKAYKADRFGNLVYRGDTRSFNAVMAPAADITVAEVQDIVEVGELEPEVIVTPGIFVDRIVKITKEER